MPMSNSSSSVVPLIGRILISPIFILAGISKLMNFSTITGYAADAHVPLPAVALACAAAIQLLGGLAILVGFRAKFASWIVFLFLIPSTLVLHNFWAMAGPERTANIRQFETNLAIMGGLLILATFGAGAYSVDSARAPKA
jgi:putative oxidoreductase